jgi:PAS domain S-box-containing protein
VTEQPGERAVLLLAEAEEPFGSRLAAILDGAGYEVLRAHSVEQAARAAERLAPDFVLLDAELPGDDALLLARQMTLEHGLPVALLGHGTDVELRVRGFEIGAVDFVAQPVEARELLARVKRHLTVSRVRRALQESEAKFRSVTESAIDAIISADAAGNVRAWNRAAEAILGWTEREMLGEPLERIIPERFREAHRAGIARINAGEPGRVIGRTVELAALHREGRELPIELSLATWLLGEERFFTGILRDVSERREAEQRFRAVTESAVDAIVSIDTLGAIVSWNRAAERIFGLTEKEMLGQSIERVIPERFREAHRAGMSRVTGGGPGHVLGSTVELAALRSDGEEFPIELSLSTWVVDGQRHYTGILRDISERRQAERRLKLYADEIADKHAELEAQHAELLRSKEALQRSLEQIRKLFAVVAEALEGQTVGGRYRLERRLAGGGFGVVYEGVDERDARRVAVKVLRPPPGGSGQAHLERFRREALAALQIDHPNVVEMLDQGVTDAGLPFLVMELLAGETLRELLDRERSLPLGEALEIGSGVASCLAALHARGVVHRDVTPANIFLHRPGGTGDAVVKVLDFGLAKLDAELGGFTVTRRSELLGTPHYVAPERVTGGEVGPETDVFSLGVTLFEMVGGEVPFPATDDPWAAIYSRVHRTPRTLASIDGRLPNELDELVARCLARDPAARPGAAEVRRSLRQLVAVLPDVDLALRVVRPAALPPPAATTWSEPEREPDA